MRLVGGKLTRQYEETALLHNRLQKGKGTKISDRGVEIPTHLVANANHTWMTDGGDFPAGGSNLVKRAQVFFKNFGHAVRLTGAAIDAINSMDVAYIKDWEQFNLTESLSQAYKLGNWYAWGTGNGRLATISSGAGSTTQTVSNNDANRALKNRDGMKIEITDGTTSRGTAVIDNGNASSTTFTIVTTLTSTTSDYVVAAGAYNLAITGIRAMVDDTTDAPVTFQGLSRNTYLSYRAFRVNASSVGLDISHLRRLLSAGIHINVGEINRDALELWSHPAQTSAYASLGWNLKRFEGNSKSVDLGFTAYEYEGINWVEDVDAPKDEIDALDFSTFAKYIAKDYGWDDKTGSILRQVPSTTSGIAYTDQYEAYLTARFNYGCTRPNKNGWVDALAVPTGF
jgi:hypothetical protein